MCIHLCIRLGQLQHMKALNATYMLIDKFILILGGPSNEGRIPFGYQPVYYSLTHWFSKFSNNWFWYINHGSKKRRESNLCRTWNDLSRHGFWWTVHWWVLGHIIPSNDNGQLGLAQCLCSYLHFWLKKASLSLGYWCADSFGGLCEHYYCFRDVNKEFWNHGQTAFTRCT